MSALSELDVLLAKALVVPSHSEIRDAARGPDLG